MWLRLTLYNGDPIVINFNFVEAFGLTDENVANSYVTIRDSSYQVKDTVDGIVQMLSMQSEMANLPASPKEPWR